MAYFHTYGLPITLSNCSNNYGPYQFPEKLIPLMILNMQARKPLPVYGDGKNIRDWLYVEDHNSAVWTIMKHGRVGEKYNIGGETEWENIRLVQELCRIYTELTGVPLSEITSLITYVKDRPGHDSWFLFWLTYQAVSLVFMVSKQSKFLLGKHCRPKAESSISAILSQLLCFGY